MRAPNLSTRLPFVQSLILAALTVAWLSASAYADQNPRVNNQVIVDDAYVHLPLPGKSNTAGYFSITNAGTEAVVLTDIETDIAARTELHSHTHEQGVRRMRKESEVTIAAQTTLVFAPGSWHVMLFEVKPGLRTGDSLPLTLRFADGSVVSVTAQARSLFDQHHH